MTVIKGLQRHLAETRTRMKREKQKEKGATEKERKK
jgi:hypothetical protein